MTDLTNTEMDKIKDRLSMLGYEVADTDLPAITFCATSTKYKILNQINFTVLPDMLSMMFIDMVCGQFLETKHSLNQLPDFDTDSALASISMGDVSMSYNKDQTASGKFTLLINKLINGRKDDIVCYRKIKW